MRFIYTKIKLVHEARITAVVFVGIRTSLDLLEENEHNFSCVYEKENLNLTFTLQLKVATNDEYIICISSCIVAISVLFLAV